MALNVHIARNSLTAGIAVAGTILAVGCGSHSSSAPAQATSQASAANSSVSPASTPSTPPPAKRQVRPRPRNKRRTGRRGGLLKLESAHFARQRRRRRRTDFTVIDFTNSGGAPCTLYGFPGVSLTNSSGAQIGAAATRNPSKASTLVTLAPGAKASAELGVANAENYPAATCKPTPSAQLKVFPPNQTQAIEVAFTTTGCAVSSTHQLSVTAVTAGAGQTP